VFGKENILCSPIGECEFEIDELEVHLVRRLAKKGEDGKQIKEKEKIKEKGN